MKALTLIQPWASLIADGRKRVETRSWSTNYRGPVAIHAGAKVDKEACARFGYDPETVPTRCVLAVARILGCVRFELETCAWRVDLINKFGTLETLEFAIDQYGDFALGRYGFLLGGVDKLPVPLGAKGALGLWEWTVPDFGTREFDGR